MELQKTWAGKTEKRQEKTIDNQVFLDNIMVVIEVF